MAAQVAGMPMPRSFKADRCVVLSRRGPQQEQDSCAQRQDSVFLVMEQPFQHQRIRASIARMAVSSCLLTAGASACLMVLPFTVTPSGTLRGGGILTFGNASITHASSHLMNGVVFWKGQRFLRIGRA